MKTKEKKRKEQNGEKSWQPDEVAAIVKEAMENPVKIQRPSGGRGKGKQ